MHKHFQLRWKVLKIELLVKISSNEMQSHAGPVCSRYYIENKALLTMDSIREGDASRLESEETGVQ